MSIKKSYVVEGMTCSGCERTVQRIVTGLDGVKSAKADFANATMSVEYDPQKVSIDAIKDAVNKVGYKFVGERPAAGQKEGRDDAVS